MIPLARIRAAAARAAPHVRRTPLVPLDERAHLKLESFQPTGSFKVRGFFAAALALPPERRAPGLLTISAGNAAQACAYVARHLGVPCRAVMPAGASPLKVELVRSWGGQPIFKERPAFVEWMMSRGWENEPEAFLHPYYNEELMAGHGGLGLELLEELPNLERVVIAVGGGGLIVGVASALKALRPTIEVVGVQSDGYPLWPSVFGADGGPVHLTPATIAEGTTAPYDPPMIPYLRAAVDRWVVVPESRLRAAIPEIGRTARVLAEGAGALPYAALDQLGRGPRTALVLSGGNIAPALVAELYAAAI